MRISTRRESTQRDKRRNTQQNKQLQASGQDTHVTHMGQDLIKIIIKIIINKSNNKLKKIIKVIIIK